MHSLVAAEIEGGRPQRLSQISAPTEATYREQAAKDALEISQLNAALDSRTVIGIAVGRVMERYDLDRDQAFATLSRLSQQHNRKVREIAEDLAGSGFLDV